MGTEREKALGKRLLMPTSACLVPAVPFSCLGHAPHFGGDVPRQGPARAHASSTP